MSSNEQIKAVIESGKAVLGLEFGSTRIKAVLIDEDHNPIASGDHEWENRLDNGIWTYTLDGYLDRTSGQLPQNDRGCERKIRREADEDRSYRIQRYDARIHGI